MTISSFWALAYRGSSQSIKWLSVCLCVVVFHAQAQAGGLLDAAQGALSAGKYGNVVSTVSNLLKSKSLTGSDTAQALLLRGMAYKALGSNALAVADFSNAQWLGKLPKADTATLLAQRAASYKLLGNTSLADRDLGHLTSLKKGLSTFKAPNVIAKRATTNINLPKAQLSRPQKIAVSPIIASKPISSATIPKTSFTQNRYISTNSASKRYPQAISTNSNVIGTADLHGAPVHRTVVASSKSADSSQVQTNPFNKLFGIFTGSENTASIPKPVASPNLAQVSPKAQLEAPNVSKWPAQKLNVATQNHQSKKAAPMITGALQPKKTDAVRKVRKTRRSSTKIAPSDTDTQFLQLASFADKARADRYAQKISAQHSSTVQKKSVMVVKTVIDNKDRFRIYLGPYPSHKVSMVTCSKLKQKGLDCIPVR